MEAYDISNQRFGKWIVLGLAPSANRCRKWVCACDCGNVKNVYQMHLISGASIGCRGCSRKGRKHGKSSSPEYKVWFGMRSRCNNTKQPNYKWYGAKGIKVCDRWNDFEKFLEDMGERPGENYVIDRIDPELDYEPGNCEWVTKWENSYRRWD